MKRWWRNPLRGRCRCRSAGKHKTEAARRLLRLRRLVCGMHVRRICKQPHTQCKCQHEHMATLRSMCRIKIYCHCSAHPFQCQCTAQMKSRVTLLKSPGPKSRVDRRPPHFRNCWFPYSSANTVLLRTRVVESGLDLVIAVCLC